MEPHDRTWASFVGNLFGTAHKKHRPRNNRRGRPADMDLRHKRKMALRSRTINRMRRRGK